MYHLNMCSGNLQTANVIYRLNQLTKHNLSGAYYSHSNIILNKQSKTWEQTPFF